MNTSNQNRSLPDHIKLIRMDITSIPTLNLCSIDDAVRETKRTILDPLAWLESTQGQNVLRQATNSTTAHYHVYMDSINNVYVHELWIFLAYLRHCVGSNLDIAIANEFKALGV